MKGEGTVKMVVINPSLLFQDVVSKCENLKNPAKMYRGK